MSENIVWLDTETGGFYPKKNPCLTIGYVITNSDLDILYKEELLIKNKYDLRCTGSSLKINKIDLKEHEKKAMDPKDAIKQLDKKIYEYFDGRKPFFAGHNLVSFDIPFVQTLYEREGETLETNYKNFDTLHFIRGLIMLGVISPKSASMTDLIPYFDLPAKDQHNALFDSLNLIIMMKKLRSLRLLKTSRIK